MNAARRKRIERMMSQLGEIRAALEEHIAEAESIRDEESDAYDNLPESLQNGERGEQMQNAISAIESIADTLQEMADAIDTAAEHATEATGVHP